MKTCINRDRYVLKLTILAFSLMILTFQVDKTFACDSFAFEYPKSNSSLSGKISAGGKHKCKKGTYVWIVLSDGHGYYLQNPQASLYADGTWDHDAIHLGGGIKKIVAVEVTETGNQAFLAKVKNAKLGQFKLLPEGSTILTKLRIKN